MSTTSACPDVATLRQIIYGGLPKAEEAALESHLLTCSSCFASVRELEAADTLLQGGGQITTLPDDASLEEQVRELVSRLKSLQTQESMASASASQESATLAPGEPVPGVHREVYGFLAPPQADDELGWLGHYRVLKVLGTGGMGVVFLAEDTQLRRPVALKAIKPVAAASQSAKERFLREARATAALKHDNVITIYQVGEERGVPFLAMELLEGEPLNDRLEREPPLTMTEVVRIGRETAEGLAAAHARGLIHRDIKPANLWLEKAQGRPSLGFRRVKILDFGLARAAAEDAQLTQHGVIVGTPAYMAPEQAAGKPLDHRCDLFSLGCVLYRLSTGQAPFHGTDVISTLVSVASHEPPPPHTVNPAVPLAVSDLVMALLAKKPEERPESAETVGEALEKIGNELQMHDIPAGVRIAHVSQTDATTESISPPPMFPRVRRSAARRLAMAAAILLLFLGPLSYFFGATVIRFATNKGELVIETDDRDVEVVVKHGGAKPEIHLLDKRDPKRTLVLQPGDYEIEVTEKPNGLRFFTKKLVLQRGGMEIVKVWLEPMQAKAALPPGVIPDRRAAEWVLLIGGMLKVNDQEHYTKTAADLPRGVYRLTCVHLFANKQVSDAGLQHFEGCKKLTHLYLDRSSVSDAGLAHFKDCKELTVLGLSGTAVSDSGLAHFQGCKNLTTLFLDNTQIGDAGLAHFKDCKDLTSLSLHDTQVSDVGLAFFKDRTNLTQLGLGHTQVTDVGLAYFRQCKNLTYLTLDGPRISDGGLAHFKGCSELWNLSLFGTKVSDVGLGHFKDCKNLTCLGLVNTKVGDAGLALFKDCKTLTQLQLRGTKVTAAGIDDLKKALPRCTIEWDGGVIDAKTRIANSTGSAIPERRAAEWALECGGKVVIKVGGGGGTLVAAAKDLPVGPFIVIRVLLDGCGAKVTDAGMECLTGLTGLTHLYLAGTSVTSDGLDHVKGLTSLVDLYLPETRITDAGLAKLKGLSKLTQLSLFHTQVTDAGLEHLQGLTSLTNLDLCTTKVTDAGLKSTKGMTKLGALALINCRVTDEGLDELLGLTAIWSLDLDGTAVTDAGLEKLKAFPALTALGVSDLPVTDAGLEHLRGMTKLTRLGVGGPRVTNAGLAHLKGLDKLTALAVSRSAVTDAGLEHLKELANLTEFTLTQTKVTPAGAANLRQALPNCKVLVVP